MLNPRHDRRRIEAPLLFAQDEPTIQDLLTDLREIRGGRFPGQEADRAAGALEIFARRYMHIRDRLAAAASRGEPLSERDRATLLALDAVLDELEPPLPTLSEEVRQIMRDVLRR